jgi:multidrug efflux pump subunit AcrA (membrane-fusion protein)
MTEERVKKREWVKTAAIIFLSIMLVLTFFSNTFMNYSLPEVSTSYVSMGSINTKIRGSGTVMANEEYVVEIEQGRKIDTVCVKEGDTVNAGDVLFILGEADSDELENAKLSLEMAEIEYERAIITAGRDKYASESKAVEDARDALADARNVAANIKSAESEITAAENDLAAKTEKYNELKVHLDKLESGEGESEEIKNLKVLLKDAEEKNAKLTADLKALIVE